jgi:hypothetical protein
MSNTLTGLIPIIYQARDIVAREMIGLVPAVTIDAQASQAAVGQTVRSPVTQAVGLTSITPAATVPNTGGQSIVYKDLIITNSYAAPIQWTGEEQRSVGAQYENIVRDQFVQAFRTLANNVEASLLATAVNGASYAVGTAGQTPFSVAANLQDFANVSAVLDTNGAPLADRHLVMGAAAWRNIKGVQSSLFKVNEAGTDELLRQGIVNQVENLSLHNSGQINNANKHIAGLTGSFAVNGGAVAVGATAVTANASVASANAGDVVSFTGDTSGPVGGATQYVVNSNTTGSVLSFNNPGLTGAEANTTVITPAGNYIPNVGLHKSAILLAARAPLMPAGGDAASDVLLVEDPVSGLVFQIAMYKVYRQMHIEIGLAWGSLAVKSEFITLLLG